MGFFADWKKFAFRGNAIDLAVGVMIGGAFGRIVSALVEDILMPVVSLVMPSGAWRSQGWVLRRGAEAHDDVVLRYGDFLGAVLDLVVVALALYLLVVKVIGAAERRIASPPPKG